MVGTGQKKKISTPALSDMHERHVLRGPRIQTIKIFRCFDRPFLNVADDIFRRDRRLQSEGGKALAYRQHLVKRHGRGSFPATLTHVVTPLVAIYRLGRTARCEIVVSARYRSMVSLTVAAMRCLTSSSENQKTVSEWAPSKLRLVVLRSALLR